MDLDQKKGQPFNGSALKMDLDSMLDASYFFFKLGFKNFFQKHVLK